jgi:hypothetical protein
MVSIGNTNSALPNSALSLLLLAHALLRHQAH